MFTALALLSALAAPVAPPPPPAAAEAASAGEIVVEGRPLSWPDARRVMAAIARPQSIGGFDSQYPRWRSSICISVAGLPQSGAQYIADDIGQVAHDIGLKAGGPGCHPNIFIIATSDPSALVAQLRASRRDLAFGPGKSALDRIEQSHDPVRWIGATAPSGADGEAMPENNRPRTINTTQPGSRIRTSVASYLGRMTVVLDIPQIDGVSYRQLGDYLAFVTLAQINPHGSTTGVESILSLFPRTAQAPVGLTRFDHAYLAGLYKSDPAIRGEYQRTSIAGSMKKDLEKPRDH